MSGTVYPIGETHADRRMQLCGGAEASGLDLRFTGPVTDCAASLGGGAQPAAETPEQAAAILDDMVPGRPARQWRARPRIIPP